MRQRPGDCGPDDDTERNALRLVLVRPEQNHERWNEDRSTAHAQRPGNQPPDEADAAAEQRFARAADIEDGVHALDQEQPQPDREHERPEDLPQAHRREMLHQPRPRVRPEKRGGQQHADQPPVHPVAHLVHQGARRRRENDHYQRCPVRRVLAHAQHAGHQRDHDGATAHAGEAAEEASAQARRRETNRRMAFAHAAGWPLGLRG